MCCFWLSELGERALLDCLLLKIGKSSPLIDSKWHMGDITSNLNRPLIWSTPQKLRLRIATNPGWSDPVKRPLLLISKFFFLISARVQRRHHPFLTMSFFKSGNVYRVTRLDNEKWRNWASVLHSHGRPPCFGIRTHLIHRTWPACLLPTGP